MSDHTRFTPLNVRGDAAGNLCRAMVGAGLSGSLSVGDTCTGKLVFVIPDIAKRALLTVRENERRGPHYTKWAPFPAREAVE